jgi:hypothetical protein
MALSSVGPRRRFIDVPGRLPCRTAPKARRCSRYPGRLRFVFASFWSLSLPKRAFDAVIPLWLLAHVEQFESSLQEATEVSDSGMIIDFPPVLSVNLW